MDLSVIIVNYRGWKHLDLCLQSLQPVADAGSEIVVVDNCSNDGRFDEFVARFPLVRFILNTGNNGFSNGCNRGAAEANRNYLLFLNSDIIANAEAIDGMMLTLARFPEIGLLSCRQQNSSGREEHPYALFPSLFTMNGIPRAIFKRLKRAELADRFSTLNEIIYPDWVSGSVMLMRSADFARTGGWCEDYWLYYEDVELCWRVGELGMKVALTNRWSMIHNHGGATRVNPRTAALTKAEVRISKHRFIARHYRGAEAFLMHLMSVIGILLGKLIPALLSVPLFFHQKLRFYGRLYLLVLGYYLNGVVNKTWMSPRAPNFGKVKNRRAPVGAQ